jgi:hypothetical protein
MRSLKQIGTFAPLISVRGCTGSFSAVQIVDEPRTARLPAAVRLPTKDVPILLAGIEAGAGYLLTGDLEYSAHTSARAYPVSTFFALATA